MTLVNSTDIFKQLVINSFMLPDVLHEEVKSYIFYDRLEVQTRHNKKCLNNQLNLGLNYRPANYGYWGLYVGHWALSYRYERQLQAVNCICCGQFYIANREDRNGLPVNLICNCDEDYVEEIMTYVSMRDEMNIDVEVEYTDQIEPDWDYENGRYREEYDRPAGQYEENETDNEDESDDGIITIDYGISWLLR